jgi:opacity protein-like surface antigen
MTRILLIPLLLGSSAFAAGPLSVGLKAGLPLTDFFNSVNSGNPQGLLSFSSGTNRYIFGPTVELRLPAGFGLEFDALYRHFNYNTSFSAIDVITNNRATGNAWEFPLLVKYRFKTPFVRPYVDSGLAFDTLSGLTETVATTVLPNRITTSSTSNPSELKNSTTEGFVLGFGVDIHAIVLHIQPEIRYTRWGSSHFSLPSGSSLSNQNQAEFMIGFTF